MKKLLLISNDGFMEYFSREITILKAQSPIENCKTCIIIGNGASININSSGVITLNSNEPIFPDISMLKNQTVFLFFFSKSNSGLDAASVDFANFVNRIQEKYDEIILIGHFTSGVCFANAMQFINRKVTPITISTPFGGIMDPMIFEQNCNPFAKSFYWRTIDYSPTNIDVLYDSHFLKYVANFSEVNKFNTFINITATCGSPRCLSDITFNYLDHYKKINGNGIVSLSSQNLSCPNVFSFNIRASYATSLNVALNTLVNKNLL